MPCVVQVWALHVCAAEPVLIAACVNAFASGLQTAVSR